MAEPPRSLAALSDAELERALIETGRHLAYPATPDLAGQVRARLEGISSPVNAAVPVSMPRLPRLVPIAACLLLAIVAGLAIFPEARTVIADRLGLRGVVIRWTDAPAPDPSPVGAPLNLGRQVTVEEAKGAVDFPLLIPTAAGLASPSEVYLSGEDDGAMISFVYPAAPGLPASGETGVGALLTQFEGETDRGLIEKGLFAEDTAGELATRIDPVTVGGEPGFWISGAPHAVFFVCFDVGECREERYRLAGDVLLWEHEGVTLRLESALPRDDALAIAESMHVMD